VAKIIETHGHIANLAQLLFYLTRISQRTLFDVNNDTVLLADAPMQVTLEKEILSDRSEVYNLSLRPTGPSDPVVMMDRIAERLLAEILDDRTTEPGGHSRSQANHRQDHLGRGEPE
jgi:hypothetical protein